MEKQKQETAQQMLSDYLLRTGRRNTRERREILAAVCDLTSGFAVEELAAAVAARGVRLSQATVYNAVELFVAAGILTPFFGNRATRYRLLPANTHHLVCLNCGKEKDVRDKPFAEILRARHYSAFTASYYEITVYGVCSSCARKAKKSNTNTNIKK